MTQVGRLAEGPVVTSAHPVTASARRHCERTFRHCERTFRHCERSAAIHASAPSPIDRHGLWPRDDGSGSQIATACGLAMTQVGRLAEGPVVASAHPVTASARRHCERTFRHCERSAAIHARAASPIDRHGLRPRDDRDRSQIATACGLAMTEVGRRSPRPAALR